MADVRAMLRAERAARNPPPARKPAKTAAPPASKNLKRKASDDDDEADWDSAAKRPRGPGGDVLPEGFFDPGAKPAAESTRSIELTSRPASHDSFTTTAQPTPADPAPVDALAARQSQPDGVDEDEWAAFEREVAASPPPPPSALAALKSSATIEAKPMTADELAAQAGDEAKNKQLSKREEEMEAEKEDAVRHLEEEFDEMEELEQRVRRLRAQREALRQARASTEEAAHAQEAPSKAAEDEEDDSDDDLDDEEDFDDWRFRGV